jgi:DNA-binding NtrC family response regulator
MTDTISVLIVEDDRLILWDIADRIEAEGYKVYQAPDADAALALLSHHHDIRLVFTDIDMPGPMNGLELAASVHDRWPPVKIIVTSGQHRADIADLPDGSMFFSKPYAHVAVLGSMRQMLAA